MNECKDCKYFEPSENMYGDGYCHNTEWLFNEPPVYKDFGCIKFKGDEMLLYVVVRISKMLDIDVMFAGSYKDCEDYIEILHNDKKYNKYGEYEHRVEQVKRYKITIKDV